jgi:hypothetical protein
LNQGFAVFGDVLFGGLAAGFDAGASRGKKRSGRADYSEDRGWVFRGVGAAIGLCVQREGDGEQESETKKLQGGLLHG